MPSARDNPKGRWNATCNIINGQVIHAVKLLCKQATKTKTNKHRRKHNQGARKKFACDEGITDFQQLHPRSEKRKLWIELHIFHIRALTGNYALYAGKCGQYS